VLAEIEDPGCTPDDDRLTLLRDSASTTGPAPVARDAVLQASLRPGLTRVRDCCSYRSALPTTRSPAAMLEAGLDQSRHHVDLQLMNEAGEPVLVTVAPPDADELCGLARQAAGSG
jgi:hypothetical protein